MKRIALFSTACACALWVASTALSQSGGGGGGGGGGAGGSSAGSSSASGGAGTSAAAGANPGIGARGGANVGGAGTSAAAGANRGAVGGQAGAATGQVGQPGQRVPPGGVVPFDGISRNPFFSDPGVRRELGLNDNQFNQLNTAFQQAQARFNQQGQQAQSPAAVRAQQRQSLQAQRLQAQSGQNQARALRGQRQTDLRAQGQVEQGQRQRLRTGAELDPRQTEPIEGISPPRRFDAEFDQRQPSPIEGISPPRRFDAEFDQRQPAPPGSVGPQAQTGTRAQRLQADRADRAQQAQAAQNLQNQRTFDNRQALVDDQQFGNQRTPAGNLTDEQMFALQQAFDEEFGRTVESTFTDPAMRQRFNQLQMQFRGFGAFNNPQVQQQLNLTPQQQQQFRQLARDWRQDLAQLNRLYAQDPQAAISQFSRLQQQFENQLGTVLSAQQLQVWRDMVGEPFRFDPTLFLGTGTAQARTSARLDPTGDRTRAEVNERLRAQQRDRSETGFDFESSLDVGREGSEVDVGAPGSDVDVGASGTDEDTDFDSDADDEFEEADTDDEVQLDVDDDLDDNGVEDDLDGDNVDDLDGDNQDDTTGATDADRSVDDSAAR